VTAIQTGSPAVTIIARARPQRIPHGRQPRRSARFAHSSVRGIHATPSRWFRSCPIDCTAPDREKAAAPIREASAERPRSLRKAKVPAPASASSVITERVIGTCTISGGKGRKRSVVGRRTKELGFARKGWPSPLSGFQRGRRPALSVSIVNQRFGT
jgi:hypothetical protein